jgi:hypothetical protein
MSPPSYMILLFLYNNRSIYTSYYMSPLTSVILHVGCNTLLNLKYVSWYVYNPTHHKSHLFQGRESSTTFILGVHARGRSCNLVCSGDRRTSLPVKTPPSAADCHACFTASSVPDESYSRYQMTTYQAIGWKATIGSSAVNFWQVAQLGVRDFSTREKESPKTVNDYYFFAILPIRFLGATLWHSPIDRGFFTLHQWRRATFTVLFVIENSLLY